MPTQHTLIISHGLDPDGLVSAALIADRLESASIPYELRFADYPNLVEVISVAAQAKGHTIYLLDLALEANIRDATVQSLVQHNEVNYFDHHQLDPGRHNALRATLKTLVAKMGTACTARLILDHFDIHEPEYRIFADCAQATDYAGSVASELSALGTELAQAISPESGLSRERVVELIRAGFRNPRAWRHGYRLTGELAEGAARAREVQSKAKSRLEQSATCHEMAINPRVTLTVACGLADTCLYMKPGYDLLKQIIPTAHACFVLYRSGSVFAGIGQRPSEFAQIVPFVTAQRGGGRDDMGGFHYDTATDEKSYPERREALLEDYGDFLKSTLFDPRASNCGTSGRA